MSVSKYAPISNMIPAVTRLIEILEICDSNNQDIVAVAQSMAEDLKTRSKEYFANNILLAANNILFITPYWPRANGEVGLFMRCLGLDVLG